MNLDRFKEPPVQYRPAPFFSVNDHLEEERLMEFIEEFHCQGWGGFFFHARTGLVTPYLGNRWFNLVKSCVRKFEEIGGRFWIYDEDGWPSGKGGGQVTKLGPEFNSMLLYCRPSRDSRPPLNTLARREMEIDGERQSFDFFAKVMPMGHLPNLLNPDAVGCFLESTHELYEIHLGNEFGETVPGIFTDEPQYATHHSQSGKLVIPWAKDMVDRFEVEHGYNLADHIESLFFDKGEFRKVRYDYYSTLTRLFVEAFSKQVHDWCEERSLSYTGHYEWEDSLLGQIHCIGSAMQHYEYMQQPGIDHLGKGIHNPWVEKQVASVSSQLGKRRVLSESYGTSGQALDFHDRRWIGNFQYALGVNFLCQHLALYSLRGARKRDYPPTLSPHQPWWEYNRLVADHFTRLSYVLSRGDRLVDVLVIHPIGSAWAEYSPSRPDRVEDVFEKFGELTWNLLRSQIDFEYGEEFIMEKHGEVRGGKLVLGRQKYRVVVVPSMKSIRRSTFELLKDLSESGGEIILIGEVPYLIEGEQSGDLQDLLARAKKTENSQRGLASTIKPFLGPGPSIEWVSGAPLRNLLIHRRSLVNSTISFMVNMDYSKTMRLNVDFEDEVQELVPHTGEVLSRPRNTTFDLAGGQGRLFLVNPDFQVDGEAEEVLDEPLHITKPDSSWKISRSQPNQAVMDFARWRPVNGSGEWSEILPVWQVQEAVSSLNDGAEFEVEYEFRNDSSYSVSVVIEDAQRFDLYINERKVEPQENSWWLDPAFRRISADGCLVKGRNRVIIRGRKEEDLSIEDAYILGDFAVRIDGKCPLLTEEESECPDISDLRTHGYPFFAGTMALETEIRIEKRRSGRPYLEFDQLGGTVAQFIVNGKKAGNVFWREYRICVEDELKVGRNEIKIKLTNSLRNLLGPRHWEADEFTGVNPRSFRDYHGWTDEYVGVPLGIEGLRLVWR